MDRRDFLKTAAFTAAGAVVATAMPVANALDKVTAAHAQITGNTKNTKPGMQYRKMGQTGEMVSALGFGLMRPPMLPDGEVNEEEFTRMVRYAIDHGLNYVDTSHVYSRGKSEEITGRILQDGYRTKVNLATKMPWRNLKAPDDFYRILDNQLESLQTDCIDFYLLHTITSRGWKGPIADFKVVEKIEKAKEQGKIKHMGFSFHASLPIFKQILASNPNWEFFQQHVNYLDTEYEAGLLGMKYASDRGMGVIAMEPLRGGFLANLPAGAKKILARVDRRKSDVAWSFDYLWNMPEISMVLSGMSAMPHVEENLALATRSSVGMLSDRERILLSEMIAHLYNDYDAVPCTGCEYCMEGCPENIAVSQMLIAYNQYKWNGDLNTAKWRFAGVHAGVYGNNSTSCTECGECLPRCPNGIDVQGVVKMMGEELKA